ncbi:MEDS domain-containing protein [Halopelagius fulvigenes]|uniref:histidine kinase n=1 Tax=Halopelagius fulvigenes TaxID=1198324 RepID=A0ABD5U5A2_9EURY
MSKHIPNDTDRRAASELGGERDALRSSASLRGPAHSGERRDDADHFALVYESRAEQFETVVPFVREGIEAGERCLYVADENSPADIAAALRDGGVDVDAAFESGQLSIRTAEETYLRGGEFNLDATRDLLRTEMEGGLAEYEGFRVAAEETWLVGDEGAQEAFMTCEAHINELLDGDAMALCQYNRKALPPAVIEDVIETHPLLVYDNTVCRNVYYTPPEEYFGPERPENDNERKLRTLVDRTTAKIALETREEYQRRLYETLADPDASFETKIQRLLRLGRERFGLEIGYFTRTRDTTFEIVEAVGDHDVIETGVTDSLCDTYCEKLLASPGPISVTDAADVGWTDDPAYERFGLDAYFATTVQVDGTEYGTLCFASETPREAPYTDAERTFLDLMGQWLGYELERRNREEYLRESYEITSDPALDFEEKLRALFDLGCEQFGLELGAMAKVDPGENRFEVEYVSDDHEHFAPGVELPLSETYCTAAIDAGGVESVENPVEAGYDGITVRDEFGIETYLGTCIEVEGDADRTFFFVSERSRDEAFSDDERTFLRLMAQWAKYELERRQREAFLQRSYEITSDPTLSFDEKIERLLEMGCDWFDLQMGGLNHLPTWDGAFRLERGVGLGVAEDEVLWTDPGDGCFCRRTVEEDDPVCVPDVRETDWTDDQVYREFELRSYVGTKVTSGAAAYGTLWFGDTDPRGREFSDAERTLLDMIGQWVSYELERERREHYQQRLCEIMAEPEHSFDEKLGDIFELGRERFDLELGGLARVDPATDTFEVEAVSGDHEHLVPGAEAPLSETYCQLAVEGGTAGLNDPEKYGYGSAIAHEEFGVETYLGTHIALDNEPDRTFFFVSTDSRDREFTETERTFHHLMSEWVKYELKQKQRERALEESNERLEQFAYAASHDLQEPLRMVTSYLQLLEKRYGDELDEDGEEFLEFAVDGAERMREMIDCLLEYSRIETKGDPFEPVALDAVLDDVLADLQIQIAESDADVESERLPTVEGDASQLRHVFQNLLENAITYSGDEPPRVHVGAERRGQELVISVRDEGIGIEPKNQDRVFDVFDRLHSREEYEGTGIGLALCERIVERHGGDIWVESEPGEGSTFSFTLPVPEDR